ncbi:hypothetical protein Poly21_06660 [Allorhodopirellula heiligendammensis]|uniref:Uncharacterized protein n=1 Tax=Allorhodopirellula heiligendammensis TaxID=2714739 RepID=A0A5C6C1Q2_9BACT|nr:hypothetical protein Poly21_06660 [Allorhodopirellula heiligendammensis]
MADDIVSLPGNERRLYLRSKTSWVAGSPQCLRQVGEVENLGSVEVADDESTAVLLVGDNRVTPSAPPTRVFVGWSQ